MAGMSGQMRGFAFYSSVTLKRLLYHQIVNTIMLTQPYSALPTSYFRGTNSITFKLRHTTPLFPPHVAASFSHVLR
jgi:hypothetical protein